MVGVVNAELNKVKRKQETPWVEKRFANGDVMFSAFYIIQLALWKTNLSSVTYHNLHVLLVC